MEEQPKKIFNTFDIAKSIALLSVVVFFWFHGAKIVNSYANNSVHVPNQILQIDENAVKLMAIQASTDIANKLKQEFEAERSAILEAFKKQRKDTDEVLDELGKVKGELKQTRDLINTASDHSYVSPKDKENTQDFKKIYSEDAEGEKFPVAWSIYYPFRDEDSKWKTGTYPMEFNVDILESQNKDGTFNRYAELYIKNDQMQETKGKKYKLKVSDIRWEKYEIKTKSLSWWNPRVALSGAFTTNDFAPMLNFSISSYGKTNSDMDWRFFIFGAGVLEKNDEWAGIFSFEPFSWNLGKALPIVENIFVGPVVTLDTNSEYGYGVQVSVPF